MGLFGNLLGQGVGALAGGYFGGDQGRSTGQSVGGQLGNLLPFAKGGRVPGPRGKARKIMAHGGEVVFPVGVSPTKAQKRAIRKRGGKV